MDVWNEIPCHFSDVQLDAFVIMLNHVHGIITITDEEGSDSPVRARYDDSFVGPPKAKFHLIRHIRGHIFTRMPFGQPVKQRFDVIVHREVDNLPAFTC